MKSKLRVTLNSNNDVVSIKFPEWTKRGTMLVNTFYLEQDDPEHPYNVISRLGLKPEEFGIELIQEEKRFY